MDARGKCPDCKGSGNSTEHDRCLPPNYYICETCKATGNAKVVWTEPIDVPDGFKLRECLQVEDKIFLEFKKRGEPVLRVCFDNNYRGKQNAWWILKPFPYRTGQVITVICDACSESGKQTFDLVYDTMIDTVFHRCNVCKGKPELKVKVTAISVKDNEFKMEGVEV